MLRCAWCAALLDGGLPPCVQHGVRLRAVGRLVLRGCPDLCHRCNRCVQHGARLRAVGRLVLRGSPDLCHHCSGVKLVPGRLDPVPAGGQVVFDSCQSSCMCWPGLLQPCRMKLACTAPPCHLHPAVRHAQHCHLQWCPCSLCCNQTYSLCSRMSSDQVQLLIITVYSRA